MTALIVLLAVAWASTLTALIYRAQVHDRRIDRLISLHATERAQTTPDLKALIGLVENLAQRIQDPQQAVIDHSTQLDATNPGPAAVNPELDDAYWSALEALIPKEALAEAAMEEELSGA